MADTTPNIWGVDDASMSSGRLDGTQLLTPQAAELEAVRGSPAINIAAVVANCTRKKILKPGKLATPVSLTIGTQEAVQTEWLRRLATLKPEVAASSLYAGRGFGIARQAAALATAPLYIASAGLGLVAGDALTPAYGLTLLGKHADAVSARVQGALSPDAWFEAMLRGPFSDSWTNVLGDGEGSVLIALTHPYARMVARSLAELAPGQQARLRIFGRSLTAVLPQVLHPAIAPYDKRLDVISPGLLAHFASRALLHFVQSVLPIQIEGRTAQFEAVEAALGRVTWPNRPRRPTRTDAQVLAWIGGRLKIRARHRQAPRRAQARRGHCLRTGAVYPPLSRGARAESRSVTRPRASRTPTLAVRAVRTEQAGTAVYAFFVAGADLLGSPRSAASTGTRRARCRVFSARALRATSRRSLSSSTKGPCCFPTPSSSPFRRRRGSLRRAGEKPAGTCAPAKPGRCAFPSRKMAAGRPGSSMVSSARSRCPRPRTRAFRCRWSPSSRSTLSVHREQFILVNKAKPLDPRLINELLPEVDSVLPRDLSAREIPSELVNLLRPSPDSPFFGLDQARRRTSSPDAVVTDSALMQAIRAASAARLERSRPSKHGDTRRRGRDVPDPGGFLGRRARSFPRRLGPAADPEPAHALGRDSGDGRADGHHVPRGPGLRAPARLARALAGSRPPAVGPPDAGRRSSATGTTSRTWARTSGCFPTTSCGSTTCMPSPGWRDGFVFADSLDVVDPATTSSPTATARGERPPRRPYPHEFLDRPLRRHPGLARDRRRRPAPGNTPKRS